MHNERRIVDKIGAYEIHEVKWFTWGDGNQRETHMKWEVISLTRGAVEFRTLQGAKNFASAFTKITRHYDRQTNRNNQSGGR